MEIYVQSCGISQEHDYRWLKIPKSGKPQAEIPRILRKASRTKTGTTIRLTDLYDCQEPTLVMAREKGELMLLVTAFTATERTKIYGRQVRNSIAWVTQDSEPNKQLINKIAAYVRENWEYVRKAIDDAVEFDDKNGFLVNREMIEEFFKYVEYLGNVKNGEDVKQQSDSSKVSSPSLKIAVVYWDMEKTKKFPSLTIVFTLFIMVIPVAVIVLIVKILSGTNFQESPQSPTPTSSPTQQK